jgi:quercetin 2,3-dioxygenase
MSPTGPMGPDIRPRPRALDLVHDILVLGGDGQVDKKAIVLQPGRWADFDPFLMMAEDWFSSGGFDWHPHRGMETITFVLTGHQAHTDNAGNDVVLAPGDAEWMTAGRGIVHREMASGNEPVHSMQLWLNLPHGSKLVEPRAQTLRGSGLPVVAGAGSLARVLGGRSNGVDGPAQRHWPVTVIDIELAPGASYGHDAPPADRAILYVRDGAITVGSTPLVAGQVGVSHPAGSNETAVEIEATQESRVSLFTGPPIGEPVVQRGPFVMSTPAEIDQAEADYRNGRFGPVPTS